MKKGVVLPMLLLTMLALSCEPENSSNKLAEQQNAQKFDSTSLRNDAAFAVKASSNCWLEIEMGRFAAASAASPKVKAFGQTMADAHTKVNEQLERLAATRNISLPSVPDNDKQRRMDDLKKKTGIEFDKEYVEMMIRSHEEDITSFRKELETGSDEDIKAWAKGLMPALHQHLEMAQELKQQLQSN